MGEESTSKEEENDAWKSVLGPHMEALNALEGRLQTANFFAETIANARNAGLDVQLPRAAEEWAEIVFNEWFQTIGKIAKDSGLNRKLFDRDMFDPRALDSASWTLGLTLEDIDPLPRDDFDAMYDLGPEGQDELIEDSFGPFGRDPFENGIWGVFIEYKQNLLSGQYNRIFPVKLVLRTAANLILNREETHLLKDDTLEYAELHIEDLRNECLKVAKYAKEQLTSMDARNSSALGERIAVGFPERFGEQDKIKKGAERFVSQFVGSIRRKGRGLPFELGFLEVNEDGMVTFTKLGVEFMLEPNPIFDLADGWKEGETLTNNEKMKLLIAIKRNVPKEFILIQNMIQWINQGANRPTLLEEKLVEEYGINKTEASLMRTGVLGRMGEMNLITREKTGRQVSFSTTPGGLKLLPDEN